MTWLPSVNGRSIEVLEPRVAEVDFDEIAHALAHLNRFAGNARTPVSVGLHTLIVVEALPDALKPHGLLHDAHETRTSEITSPAKEALRDLAWTLFGPIGGQVMTEVREELERRHDAVIHAAAGLAPPTPEQKRLIKQADLIALATERRDFLIQGGRAWIIDALGVCPLPRVIKWRPPDKVADALSAAFRTWLPALRRRAA